MEQNLQDAFVFGYERLVSWTDLLDRINVFPVADSDTGCNLKISLAPLRQLQGDRADIMHRLLASASGNSGNIAVRFFSGFLTADSSEKLLHAAKAGRDYAWQAIADPKPGTILTVFDELARALTIEPFDGKKKSVSALMDHLQEAVSSTSELLPDLRRAGVIDAGALGMFIYLEGFFKRLVNQTDSFRPITEIFKEKLQISSSFKAESANSYCVDTMLRLDGQSEVTIEQLSKLGQSVVAIPDKSLLKIHLHTDNPQALRNRLESFGEIVQWSDDDIGKSIKEFSRVRPVHQAIHIMTDAAGSVTRETAGKLGITLLDSYIIAGDRSLPETLCSESDIYPLMRKGKKVSTAQASIFERHQCYKSVLEQYPRVLYICVGSVFTGNYDVVMAWKKENDPDNRLMVIDSAAASGRLGAIAIATARFANTTKDENSVIGFAEASVKNCEEYVFPDRLKYLVAGGRLSKTRGFFGDKLHMKPVISPTEHGAKKVGIVRDQEGQIEFALQQLKTHMDDNSASFIMLEYSDNLDWVRDSVMTKIKRQYPQAELMLQPLSLTSGVHMGPGTWAVAFLP